MNLTYYPKKGRSKLVSLSFAENHAGQGGRDFIMFTNDKGSYALDFESAEEVTELLRQAALVRMNREDPSNGI